MCKKALSLLLALVMCLALVPVSAFAADANPWTGRWENDEHKCVVLWQDGNKVIGFQWGEGGECDIEGMLSGNVLKGTQGDSLIELTISAEGKSINGYSDSPLNKTIEYSGLSASFTPGSAISWSGLWNVYSSHWGATFIAQNGNKVDIYAAAIGKYVGTIDGNVVTAVGAGVKDESDSNDYTIKLTMSADGMSFKTERWYNGYEWADYPDGERLSRITYAPSELKSSEWATETLKKANDMGLIPDSLKGADLTKPITRKEFAAVAVKTYENLTGKTTTPAAKNPFTDTNDTEVLKAYNVGITSGTAADKFSPDVLLNREQAATMLTRVLKAAYIPGWTGATDANYTLNFTQPAKFADDDKISDWAKPSVYFMAANGIISGTGNNMFSPRAVTTSEQAANYASATREQALVIAVRMVENLKGKPLDYKESVAQGTTTPEPTKPANGDNSSLSGTIWSKYPDQMDWLPNGRRSGNAR